MFISEIIRNPQKLKSSIPFQNYLYHGTQIYLLALILRDNALYQSGHWGRENEPHGVRCTRSINIASDFAFEQENPGGILVLDWRKISKIYKTIPYADTDVNRNDWPTDEQEEVVLTRLIKPLDFFLEEIIMRKEEHDKLKSGFYLEAESIEEFITWTPRSKNTYRQAITILMNYPKMRVL